MNSQMDVKVEKKKVLGMKTFFFLAIMREMANEK